MGTSGSSKGPGPNVLFVPPWVAPIALPEANGDEDAADGGAPKHRDAPKPPSMEIAPARRFAGARRALGGFGSAGSRKSLQKGLGHYVRSGLGGARLGSERLSGTARTAGSLYNVLDTLRTGGTPPELGVNAAALAGRPAREVGDSIADAIRPVDGTQDAEASRDAISRAIADLLENHPDADVAALTPDNIDYVTQAYLASDLCARIELDVGNAILDKAPNPATGIRRLEEIKQYVRESIAACFRARRERGETLTRGRAAEMCAQVIRDTLAVFEEYAK